MYGVNALQKNADRKQTVMPGGPRRKPISPFPKYSIAAPAASAVQVVPQSPTTPIKTETPKPMKKKKTGRHYWGKAQWKALHSYAATYTPDKAPSFKMYVYSLTELLPCEQCRRHLKENLIKYPIEKYLGNRDDLIFWTYLLHDGANKIITATNPEDKRVSPPFDEFRSNILRAVQEDCVNCKTY